MILYALRLLVALLTFAVGIAAAWLFDFKSAPAPVTLVERDVTSVSFIDREGKVREEMPQSCDGRRVLFGGILQSKTINESSPAYPKYGKAARVSGKVIVKVLVDEDGRVLKAHAQTGFGMLPEAAEKDALETRLTPVRLSGEPVRVSGYIMYDFVLD
jgi:hypothetical protein